METIIANYEMGLLTEDELVYQLMATQGKMSIVELNDWLYEITREYGYLDEIFQRVLAGPVQDALIAYRKTL